MFSIINSKINQVKISQLIDKLGYLLNQCTLEIDSRKINQNSIFCAYKGTTTDGRNYIHNALQSGAKCIIQEGEFNLNTTNNYAIENLCDVVGILASHKNNHPSSEMLTIGVTGTNGKTSITQWLAQIYSIDTKVAVIGTLGGGIYPHIKYLSATTPDPITLQNLFSDFLREQVKLVVMEVSSHALDQGRVNGVTFNTAVFTNLTQDHLDYHGSMEQYYLAKKELFFWYGLKNAVINVDDIYGKRLYKELQDSDNPINIITYGVDSGDIQAKNIVMTLDGIRFILCYKNLTLEIKVQVIGEFNIYNILAVVGILLINQVDLHKIPDYLKIINPVKGRMDIIPKMANQPLVVIDFAHTPDALENALQSINKIEHKGKVYCIFGCGGDRDTSKRSIMGKIAIANADYVIITSDNPRTEEPTSIINQIIMDINDYSGKYTVEVDRELAIKKAIKMAQTNDIVLIAGKGHEEYQEVNGVKTHFSDFEIAKKELNNVV